MEALLTARNKELTLVGFGHGCSSDRTQLGMDACRGLDRGDIMDTPGCHGPLPGSRTAQAAVVPFLCRL